MRGNLGSVYLHTPELRHKEQLIVPTHSLRPVEYLALRTHLDAQRKSEKQRREKEYKRYRKYNIKYALMPWHENSPSLTMQQSVASAACRADNGQHQRLVWAS